MLSTQMVSLTNHCNLSCTYCWYETDASAYAKQQLSPSVYGAWFAKCEKVVALETIYLTGGEPTLHESVAEIIELANMYFRRIVLLTNGVSMARTAELRGLIVRSAVEVHISLDHVSSGLGDSVRGGTKATLLGIRRLAESGVPIQVTMVLTSKNAVDLPAVIAFCRELGLALEVNSVAVSDSHPLSVQSMSPSERENIAGIIRDAADLLGRHAYYSQVRGYLRSGSVTPLRRCRSAANGVFIESDGGVLICGHRRSDVLGSIVDDSPLEILNRKSALLDEVPAGPCVTVDCLMST